MIFEYFKMALSSVRGARFRSALTMFGIIIGVSSVVVIVSMGEGVKRQIASQMNAVSDSLIVVRPGKNTEAKAFSLDGLRSFVGRTGSLSEKDWQDMLTTPGVKSAVPIGIVSGIVSYEDQEYTGGSIIATTDKMASILNQKILFGEFFAGDDHNKNVAIIGQDVAEKLFKENVPVGKSLVIRGKSFIVQGIFEQQKSATFATVNVNNSIVIPYQTAMQIGDNIQILQIYAEAESADKTDTVADNVAEKLKTNHAGQEDFTVLKKGQALEATNDVFYQITLFIAGVAFISFIVGGIGIMNIMFATVSERTREIGIRKAIGATNAQILGQFVMESIVLSIIGGMIGIGIALLMNAVVQITTDLHPVATIEVIVIAAGFSIFTGIISGLLPAAKAARKDPISALRADV